ncbi:unnamed protein product, partial [Adineta steineri]
MDRLVIDNSLSNPVPTSLAVGGALVLVAGALIHRHRDKFTSLLVENLANDELNRDTDWANLTIPAR